MASTPETASVDGRSNEVEVACEAPPGVVRTHVLAIGVSKYDRNPLRFADRDASDFGDLLLSDGRRISQAVGIHEDLSDAEVSVESIRAGLRAIREVAQPEDLVVVFLAGHADVRRGNRFCLLLPGFPFPEGGELVANRGVLSDDPSAGPDDPSTLLPFSEIYRDLARLDAGARLVVIDACQAGAVLDDPLVRRIQERCDDGAQGARTSYLLAARPGVSAGESAALEHGLFTYLLLRGLGATDLPPDPLATEAAPPGVAPADLDGDGRISADELGRYASDRLPRLASAIAANSRRPGADPAPARAPEAQVQMLVASPIPLARIPGGPLAPLEEK